MLMRPGLLWIVLSQSARLDAAQTASCSEDIAGGSFLQTGVSRKAKMSKHVREGQPSHDLPKQSIFPWSEAMNKLHHMPPKAEVREAIWSNGGHHECGSPCVAHCIAGQPREFISTPGLRKALKHRVFQKFSAKPVVFAVFVTSAYHNAQQASEIRDGLDGYARTQVEEIRNDSLATLVAGMEEVGVQRALLLNESCHDPSCMENPQLQCDAQDLGLRQGFDNRDGRLHHICDVQFKRFQSCMTLVEEYEQEHRMKFDWVTRNRPDVYWLKPIVSASQLEHRTYVTPWNVAYGAIDWFFALPRGDADIFAKFADEASCSQLHHPHILPNCKMSLGCECWMASWLYQNEVQFEQLTSAPYIVSKFCGAPCALDWNVSDASIEDR